MESFSIIKICFVILLTGNVAFSILVGNEKQLAKRDPKTEELEWVTKFAPPLTHDGKKAKQVDFSHNSLCPSGITGQFPYPDDCKRFINCWKGRGMIQVCAPGTLFNPATGECDFPDKVKCVQGDGFATRPQPLITRFPIGRPPIGENPRISGKSKDNYQIESSVYESYSGRYPQFGSGHVARPRPTRPNAAKLQQKVECPPGSAGLYPHPTDCTQFLNCWGGRMFIQKCGPGTYFNPDMSVCDHVRGSNCDVGEYINVEQGSIDEISSNSPDVETDINEEYNSGPPEVPPSVPNDPFPDIDVRSGVEEDSDIPEEQPYPKSEDSPNVEAKKDRDPSWGKILNYPSRRKPEGNVLFYDAHGNPVRSDQFFTKTGKPYYYASSSEQQPTYAKPDDGKRIPGDSNVYYLRPHNHVMNQNPPHLQNNWSVMNPIYHNPQSYPQSTRTQTDRPPAFNPYFPSAPSNATVPGHYILVNDKNPVETRVHLEQHQGKEVPATFLLPPREKYPSENDKPTEWGVADFHRTIEKPSEELLPPRAEDQIISKPIQVQQSSHSPVNLEYSGWKPFFNDRFSTSQNIPEAPHKETENPSDLDFSSWKVNNNREVPHYEQVDNRDSSRDRWITTTQEVSVSETRNQEAVTTTASQIWPVYYGNKNLYGPSLALTRTFSATTETTPTSAPETTSTTNRVYVVYPVKNNENRDTQYNAFHTHSAQQANPDNPKHYPYENSHKHKNTNPKKATEEEFKKRIKSEVDFDSQEDLNVKDVEMYSPTLDELLPNAGKDIRLKPLSSHLDGYIEMKNQNGEWGLVCDKDYGWMINEANVVCKELGYGRGAQISWQGYPLDSSTESIPVTVSEVICNGNEESLKDCHIIYGDNDCDITKNAVGLRCFDNVTTQCHPEEVEYNNSCYRLVKRDDFDDVGFTLEEAANYCNRIGGRISDVISQDENNFISEWLMEKHPDVRSVLTGGIGSAVMGRSLWMWYGSQVPMLYQNWWKGWADEKKIKHGTVHEPSCVVLRKSYPCFVQNEDETQVEVDLGNVDPEFCSANYFYWDVVECKKIKDLKLPHLCKKPLEEIGCVTGRGEEYSGTASVTSSGLPCLPWDHPDVKEKLAHQVTLQEWSTKLEGHNFCRNLGRKELHPWCFVEGKENSEYCSIPQCWDSVPGYSRASFSVSSCDETQFACKATECIDRRLFCDGKKDCSNGRDEAMCSIFLQEFTKLENNKMSGNGKEQWPGVNENTCAKLCLENKKFKCKSFSFNKKVKTCHISDMNVGLSGQVIPAEGWTYHELSVSSLNCSEDKSVMGCLNGKCVSVVNVCDGKDDCGDGSDELDCDRMNYQIRLVGGDAPNMGRVEIKGEWGAVCDDKFDERDGEVVCRELGYKQGLLAVVHDAFHPTEDPNFLVDDLECVGNETSIRSCPSADWGKHDCRSQETVGVLCRVPEMECMDDQWQCADGKECIPVTYLCDGVPDCDDGSDENRESCNKPIMFRIADGPNLTSGRLEVRYLGVWGTLCDDNINDGAASVICRSLGYEGPSSVLKNAHFGPGKGPIWLDGVQCTGNETNINECDHSDWGKHNCKHDEDVSLSCSKKSVERKPIAASSEAGFGRSSLAKLREVLIRECRDRNGTLESVRLEPRARVVASNVAREGIPWQASVRVRTSGKKSFHWCGAIVISPYHVLTAGHCLRDYSKPAYFIRVGDFDTELDDPEEQEFGIDHLYIHPEFNRKLHLNNDIALVKVKGEIRLGKRVKPACLAPSTDIYVPGTNCTISGWGSVSQESKGYSRTLRKAHLPILEPSVCRAPYVYGDLLSDGMFCAGSVKGGADACQGDSGGPIMCDYDGKHYLYGITSWGHGCGRANKPGVYTNIAYYSDWIQEKIEISLA